MKNYYDRNAQAFFEATVHADMSKHYLEFLKYLPKKGHILDAGCGSGRDSLHFKQLGYKVTALDASKKLGKLAANYIGQDVLIMPFQEMAFEHIFDGIWASASLLHVPSQEMNTVIKRFETALKPGGGLYAGFKYGVFEGERSGRYFYDLTEEKAEALFENSTLQLEKMWITKDVRPERVDECWLNILAIKTK